VVAKYCDEHICLSVCASDCQHIYGTTCTIFTNFSVHVAYVRGSVLLWQADEIPRARGILGFSSPLTMHYNAFAAKAIIQSPIMSCSRRYYSIAAAFTAKGIIQYRPGRGWWEHTVWAKCDLLLPCFLLKVFQVPHRQPCTNQGNIWHGRAAYANFILQCVTSVDKKTENQPVH